MGVILDSSVVIAAERRGDTVEQLIEQIVNRIGDQEAALSAIGLTELIHGIYRARAPEVRLRRESFLAPISRSPKGITTPRLCCSPSIFPARSAVSFVYGYTVRSASSSFRNDSRRKRTSGVRAR
jgi:hypothetical protein